MIDFEKLKEAYELLMSAERVLHLSIVTLNLERIPTKYILSVDKYSGDEGVLLFEDIDELIKTLINFQK